jgi:tellurite resistance protein
MKKLIIICLIALSTNSALARKYENFLDCQLEAIQAFKRDAGQCDTQSTTRYEQSLCKSKAHRRFADATCSQALQISLDSVSFMYKQLAEIDNPANLRLSTSKSRDDRYQQLTKMINEEVESGLSRAMREQKNLKLDYEAERASRNIEASIRMLGGVVKDQASDGSFTYIMKGKIINCSRFGNTTTCN